MLDLNPGIALDEHVPASLVEQEFHRTGTGVSDLTGERHRVGTDPFPQFGIQVRCRCQLDDLLVAPLQAAVPFEEVNHVAVGVGQDLHLDVARVDHRLLEKHRGIPERRLRLPAGGLDRLLQVVRLVDPPHPPAAATRDSLHEYRKTHRLSGCQQFGDRTRRGRRCENRQAGPPGLGDGAGLVTGQLQHISRGSHKRDARLFAGPGQVGVLRQKPVTGIDGIGVRVESYPDDLIDREIGPDRMSLLTYLIRLIGFQPVLRIAILVRIDRDRGETQLVGRAKRTDGDLSPVGDQNLVDHCFLSGIPRSGECRTTPELVADVRCIR